MKNALIRLRRDLGLPQTLKEAGVDPRQVWQQEQKLVETVLADPCCQSNPLPVDAFTVRRVLKEVTGVG